jgi:hypothetical protein
MLKTSVKSERNSRPRAARRGPSAVKSERKYLKPAPRAENEPQSKMSPKVSMIFSTTRVVDG